MDEIPIVQRERCKCKTGEPAHRGELVIAWNGDETERVTAAAALLGIEPEALVRRAVEDRLRESVFTSADEQAHPIIEEARGGPRHPRERSGGRL